MKVETKGVALLETTQIIPCIKIEEIDFETVHFHTFEKVISTVYVQDYGEVTYLPITDKVLQFWEIKK